MNIKNNDEINRLLLTKKRKSLSLHAVLAQSLNNVIGAQEGLPWNEPEDLKSFMRLTMGASILMGRQTWDTLQNPLPGRKNIVLSRNTSLEVPSEVILAPNLSELFHMLPDESELFIIGGSQIYELSFPLLDKIYLTLIKLVCKGNVYFNALEKLNAQEWQLEKQHILSPRAELFEFTRSKQE